MPVETIANKHSNRRVWKCLPLKLRLQISETTWEWSDSEGTSTTQTLVRVIAQARRSRERTILRAPVHDRVSWTADLLDLPEDTARHLLRHFLLVTQQEVIEEFLDSLLILHAHGIIADEVELDALQDDAVFDAGCKLLCAHDTAEARLYLGFLVVQGSPWTRLSELLSEATNMDTSLFPSEDTIEQEQEFLEEARLTSLDQVLLRSIDDTLAGSDGALSPEHMVDVVDELIENNPRRDKSYYHKGYVDVVFRDGAQPRPSSQSESSRLWYLSGAVIALHERSDHKRIAALADRETLRILCSIRTDRARVAVKAVFESLCEEFRVADAADFLSTEMIWYAGLFESILRRGTLLLRHLDFHAAGLLFELLEKAIQALTEGQTISLGDMYFELRRRQAHCLRLQRHFGAARAILNDLLADPSAPEKPSMLTDVAMMDEGFRGLLDVNIPNSDVAAFIERLNRMKPKLEEASRIGGNAWHAQYCLGVLAVAEKRDPDRAAEQLEYSVTHMLRHSSVYDLKGLLSRARFYMGLARAETLNESFAQVARVRLQESIEEGFVPPVHLLTRYFDALALTSPDAARQAAEFAVQNMKIGIKMLEVIKDSGVAAGSLSILTSLMMWAAQESMTSKRRFEILSTVLRDATSGDSAYLAADALDGLEQMARKGDCREEFVDLLHSSEAVSMVWSESDRAWASAIVNESLGEYTKASALFRSEFHRILASREFDRVEQAADIVVRLSKYGISQEIDDLERRLQGCREDEVVQINTEIDVTPLVITIVGGDEMQARFDDDLRRTFSADDPTVTLEFRHTNWGSNWGEQFRDMKPLLNRSDAVVVMRLIRTTLGCNLRRYCPLWIGCSGLNRFSIDRAIRLGITQARLGKLKILRRAYKA